MSDSLKQCWGFMIPWCDDLLEIIRSFPCGVSNGIHVVGLDVLVFHQGRHPEKFRCTAEGIKLLAAVAHVDYDAWRYLVTEYCGLEVNSERIIIAQFLLTFDREDEDESRQFTIQNFCEVHQIQSPSQRYLDTLRKITALDQEVHSHESGLVVQVPVQVYFAAEYFDDLKEEHEKLQRAEKHVKEVGEQFDKSQVTDPGSIRCNFVLKPMRASYDTIDISPAFVLELGKLVARNVWFSKVSVSMLNLSDLLVDARVMKETIGHLFARLFDSAARNPELSITRYRPEIDSAGYESSPVGSDSAELEELVTN